MKQYLKLLMAREGREVLGRRCSNLWLLTLVLTATFASIAFSHGSMIYLQDKMEDPFTNWVDIPIEGNGDKFKDFALSLDDPQLQEQYGFSDVHDDHEEYYDMQGRVDKYLRCRHFVSINTPLVRKILEEDNLIGGCVADSNVLQNEHSLGLIVTADVIRRLGYSLDSIPTYLNYKAHNRGADTLGLRLLDDIFYPVPLPVLAVVRRLPSNVDMMGTNFLAVQPNNDIKRPFDFNVNPDYIAKLRYFIPETLDVESFETTVKGCLPDSLAQRVKVLDDYNADVATWKPGRQVVLDFGGEDVALSQPQWVDIDQHIAAKVVPQGVVRIYHYEAADISNLPSSYISLTFQKLDNIRAFEEYAKGEHGIQIDMSQVASKENFNAVTVMARVLSSAMVLFSLVCIIMFLVNMLQSYFQKVKRNIGTFKAFGMNAAELIYVYTLILIMIVCTAVVMALAITWLIQIILPLLGIEKDGFNLLSLWNPMTYVAASVVVVSTIATVSIVMSRMLSQTPGDLIYDRN